MRISITVFRVQMKNETQRRNFAKALTEKDCNRITQIIPGKSLNHGKVCSLTGGSHTFSPFTYSISNAKKSCLSTSQNPTFRWNPLLRPQLEIYVINSFNLTRKICLDAIGKRFSRFNLPYWGIFFSFPFENFLSAFISIIVFAFLNFW